MKLFFNQYVKSSLIPFCATYENLKSSKSRFFIVRRRMKKGGKLWDSCQPSFLRPSVSCKNPLPPEKVVLFYLKTDRYWKNEAEDSHTFFSRRCRTLLHSKNKY